MSTIVGRLRRTDNAPTVLLQARVTPAVKEAVDRGAQASGLAISYYVDELIQSLLDTNGMLEMAVPASLDQERALL